MSVIAKQQNVTAVRFETSALRQRQEAVPKHAATPLSAVFVEQQGVGRLEEWAAALDFPLDFQI